MILRDNIKDNLWPCIQTQLFHDNQNEILFVGLHKLILSTLIESFLVEITEALIYLVSFHLQETKVRKYFYKHHFPWGIDQGHLAVFSWQGKIPNGFTQISDALTKMA